MFFKPRAIKEVRSEPKDHPYVNIEPGKDIIPRCDKFCLQFFQFIKQGQSRLLVMRIAQKIQSPIVDQFLMKVGAKLDYPDSKFRK